MTRFWIGVASLDHVRKGVAGGFAQLCHGRQSAVSALAPGDFIVYYSPRAEMRAGPPVQAFTGLGVVDDGSAEQVDMGNGFKPFRRAVRFLPSHDAPIKPLLPDLSFTAGRQSWGYVFRRGQFEISQRDFALIADAMGVRT